MSDQLSLPLLLTSSGQDSMKQIQYFLTKYRTYHIIAVLSFSSCNNFRHSSFPFPLISWGFICFLNLSEVWQLFLATSPLFITVYFLQSTWKQAKFTFSFLFFFVRMLTLRITSLQLNLTLLHHFTSKSLCTDIHNGSFCRTAEMALLNSAIVVVLHILKHRNEDIFCKMMVMWTDFCFLFI